MRRVAVGFVLCALPLLATGIGACGSGQPNPPASPAPVSSTAATDQAHEDGLQQYFNSLAKASVHGTEQAAAGAGPGSPAEAFAQHQANMIRATRGSDSGQSWTISTSVTSSDTVDWVATGQQYTDTAEFSQFLFDAEDRLVGWTVDDKQPLHVLVGEVDRGIQLGDISVRVSTGYRTVSGALELTYEASGGGESETVSIDGYVNKGRTRKGQQQPYQLELGRKAAAFGSSIFPKSDWGGALLISSYFPTQADGSIDITARPFTDPTTKNSTEDET